MTTGWGTPETGLQSWIAEHRTRALDAYLANPLLIAEHGLQEDSFRTGGYAHRQVLELVQNGADALHRSGRRGRIQLRLQDDVLYCANEGAPFTQAGLEAVCHAYLSDKTGDEMGRFGLGFKSVLGITDSPLVLSRSISFRFDATASEEALKSLSPDASKYPVLRLPILADADAEMAADPVLAEIGQWATTIVRLPLSRGIQWLDDELDGFRKEFLLFAPYVSRLEVRRSDGAGYDHFCEALGSNRYRLGSVEGSSSDWMVWQRTHDPSAAALAEVSQAIKRGTVTVTYAAPLDEALSLGRFWAYFPLNDFSSAKGIHNAPWHISDDRTNLLPGQFNTELLDVLAELIVEALPHLSKEEDPARHFDYMPARGRETDNFGDLRLTEIVPALAAEVACVPNANGHLVEPSELQYANFDLKIEVESFMAWSNAPGRPVLSPHWSCYKTPTRRARLRQLLRGESGKAATSEIGAAKWLERLVGGATDEQCDAALGVFFGITDELTRRDMSQAAILPDTEGKLRRLDESAHVFLRGKILSSESGIGLIRPSFLDREHVEDRLRLLAFQEVDPGHELRRLATTAVNSWTGQQWRDFWDLVSEVSANDAGSILLDHVRRDLTLKVLCRDKSWQKIGEVVVAGLVEPIDRSLVLDDDHHQLHLGLLRNLGVAPRPVVSPTASQDLTQLEYRRLQRAAYLDALPPRGRPDSPTLDFRETEGPTPLHVLRRFTESGDTHSCSVWTRELLAMEAEVEWTLTHPNTGKFEPKAVTAPHLWAAQTYGLVDTSWGPRPARRSLHPQMNSFDPLLPVCLWPAVVKIRTITNTSEIPIDLWREFLERVPTGGDAWRLGELLGLAAARLPEGEIPTVVPAARREGYELVPPEQLLLAVTEGEAAALVEAGLAHAAVKDISFMGRLVERWGCRPASSTLRVEIVPTNPSEPVILLDRFRGLRDYTPVLDDYELVSCSTLQRVVTLPAGTESYPEQFAVSGRTIYFEDSLDDEAVLERVSAQFGLDMDHLAVTRVLHDALTDRVKSAIAEVRAVKEPAEKLLRLLPIGVLKARLPAGLLDTVRAVSADRGDLQVSELLIHVHGYSVLVELRRDLKDEGYPVPDRWAASDPAVAFVRSLGFPTEYAGERNVERESDVTVLGPPNLKPLHQYQERLAERIRELARARENPERALLSLPTGAGKTRVTVEALVRSILDQEVTGPILWIAQTDELCEQAVQTWMTVWRQFGDRPLRLSRLWKHNEVGPSDAEAHVVVATDAKLDSVRKGDDYEWLKDAALVVLDEAHGATAPGITATLGWLGIERRSTARPFLGLTATPFSGRGAEKNKALASRFNVQKIDVLGEDPYGQLQELEVLAKVEHRILAGSSFAMDESERQRFSQYKDVPPSVLERVGRDQARTLRLLDDIAGLPRDWPVLVFTSSVLAAQTLAALLRVRGLSSAAVSGDTPTAARRRTIEQFRNGGVQVLTNCEVLTQGFDAPGVRALYIARPTFSPNAYIQMVGRGMRGPANGGTSECLIVNVEDTFEAFGDELAYKEFDYLWEVLGG